MITVQTFLSNAAGSLHGVTLNRVSNAMDKLRQAAMIMLGRISPPDTIRRYRITNALYDQVYNYIAPTDLKGINKIIDLRPIGPRSGRDEMDQTTLKQFDVRKIKNTLVIETINGIKTLRASKALDPQILLADLSTFDLSADVSVFGDASNLSQNTLDFVTSQGSVQFDLSGATGSGGIEITLPDGVDLSDLLNLGSLFEWANFPAVSRLNYMELYWGTNSSNYWKKQVTAPNDRSEFESQAWTQQRFDWQSATKVGSPDETAITYLKVLFNYDTGTALTGVKVDSITASLGAAYELIYYSRFLFQAAADSSFKETPTLASDIIFCDPLAEMILMYEFLKIMAGDLKGKNGDSDYKRFDRELEGDGRNVSGAKLGLYKEYTGQNPEQSIPVTTSYYDFNNTSGNDDGIDEGD